jgi:hypothetical protein
MEAVEEQTLACRAVEWPRDHVAMTFDKPWGGCYNDRHYQERSTEMQIKHWTDVPAQQAEGIEGVTVRWVINEDDGAPHFAMPVPLPTTVTGGNTRSLCSPVRALPCKRMARRPSFRDR